MTDNKQTEKVSIVHIWNYISQDKLTSSLDIVNLIENNAVFLAQHAVEYIILDNLHGQDQENFLLGNLHKIPSYQNKKLEYVKDKNSDLKEIFLTASKFATHPNIFFVFNELSININNVFDIEKSAPLLQKSDLSFFQQNVPPNFHPKDFKLYMKKNKNLYDKLKLIFTNHARKH